MSKERVVWVDISKGIGILLVVVGHCLNKENDIISRGLIYSFHMPLFFILTGYTFAKQPSWADFRTSIKKRFLRLWIPAYLCVFISFVSDTIISINNQNLDILNSLYKTLLSILFWEGMDINAWGIIIPGTGMSWFFIVMFFAYMLFYVLLIIVSKPKTNTLITVLISIIGYIIISLFVTIPFSIELALFLLPFLSFGRFILPRININKISSLIISLVVWISLFTIILAFSSSYFEIVPRSFPVYPICIIAAVFGSLVSICLSFQIGKINHVNKVLAFVGKYSLYFMLSHYIGGIILSTFFSSNNVFIKILINLIIIVPIAMILIFFRQYVIASQKRRRQQHV